MIQQDSTTKVGIAVPTLPLLGKFIVERYTSTRMGEWGEHMILQLKSKTTAILTGAALLSAGMILTSSLNTAAATNAQDRPAAEIRRDAGRKPEQVLAYLDIKPGMKIWDHASSTGYYAALFSKAVGQDGKIYAQNSPRMWERLKDGLEPRYAEFGNVEAVPMRIREYEGPDGELDMVFLALIYHHIHFNEDTGNATPPGASVFFNRAFDLLKPGGTLAIIEHQAPNGTPREQSAAWHRATLQNAIDDVTSAGFELIDTSDILANPNDPQNVHFRQLESGRDTSQRYIVKFRKPE